MICTWRKKDDTHKACSCCGQVATLDAPEPIRHTCRGNPPRSPCVHLGAATGTRQCPSCAGHVRVKLFACQVHGETALAKQIEGAACCATCRDYRPVDSLRR